MHDGGDLDGVLSGSPYPAGDGFSLADAHLAPVMHHFAQMPAAGGALGPLANLASWWKRIGEREAVRATVPSLG